MNELINAIEKMLNDHKLWVEEIWKEEPNVIKYEIRGDWKHDHLYSDHLVGEYLKEKNIPYYKGEHVTYEDGTDWYESIHFYMLLGGEV